MVRLSLDFLGTFQVVLDERPITRFRSSNVQGLLVYLALNADRPTARDQLAVLFWPEESESVARSNLRQSLYQLKKILNDGDDGKTSFLLINRQTVQLNAASSIRIDVLDFLAFIEKGELGEAAALYNGDLLPGFSGQSLEFEEWLRVERERLHQQALESLFELGEQKLAGGKSAFGEVQELARRQLMLEPWREEAHRQLMQALALSGKRSAAISQYEICVDVLAEELGIPPSLETTAVYKAILNSELMPETAPETTEVTVPNNLPRQATPFIGRQSETAELISLLNDGDKPIITVIGPGGMGKTSLVLNAAREMVQERDESEKFFPDGIFFVPLALLSEPTNIPIAIADTVGLRFQGRSGLFEQVKGYLRDKQMLLMLDNFEHLTAWAGTMNELVNSAKKIQFCVTSRQRLHLQSETLFSIAALDVPANGGAATLSSAEKLFLQSVNRIWPGFEPSPDEAKLIGRICCLVEGMPLAIVLAAGWVDMLPLREIVAEIEEDIDFLATDLQDMPERQRSLRATFDYSWKLLSTTERNQYVQLSVFRGGFTREAVTAVAGTPRRLLARLVNKSLLQYDPGKDRFQIHGLLRQFGEEKLRQADLEDGKAKNSLLDEVRRAHSHYYLELAGKRKLDLLSWKLEEAVAEIVVEYENIRAAWDWAIEGVDTEFLGQASDSIFRFHRIQSLLEDGSRMMAKATSRLAQLGGDEDSVHVKQLYGRVLGHEGMLTFFLGHSQEATDLLQKSVATLQDVEAEKALVSPLNHLAYVKFCADQYDDALALSERAIVLSEKYVDFFNRAYANRTIGSIYSVRGDYLEAKKLFERALSLSEQIGDRRGQGLALNRLAITGRALNEYEGSKKNHEKALKIFREIGYRQGEGQVLNRMGVLIWYQGDFEAAKDLFEQALAIGREIGDWQLIGATLHRIGNYLWNRGKHGAAAAAYREVVRMYHQIGDRQSEGYVLDNLALLSLYEGKETETLRYCGQVWEIADGIKIPPLMGYCLTTWGHAFLALDQLAEAAEKYDHSLRLWQELGQERSTIQPMAGLAWIDLKQGREQEAVERVEAILIYLEKDNLEGSDEPLRVYDICIQILKETGDDRWEEILQSAHERLQSWAALISDAGDRRAFLEHVPFHRRIEMTWEEYSKKAADPNIKNS